MVLIPLKFVQKTKTWWVSILEHGSLRSTLPEKNCLAGHVRLNPKTGVGFTYPMNLDICSFFLCGGTFTKC